jgi:hypothetical protein
MSKRGPAGWHRCAQRALLDPDVSRFSTCGTNCWLWRGRRMCRSTFARLQEREAAADNRGRPLRRAPDDECSGDAAGKHAGLPTLTR